MKSSDIDLTHVRKAVFLSAQMRVMTHDRLPEFSFGISV